MLAGFFWGLVAMPLTVMVAWSRMDAGDHVLVVSALFIVPALCVWAMADSVMTELTDGEQGLTDYLRQRMPRRKVRRRW